MVFFYKFFKVESPQIIAVGTESDPWIDISCAKYNSCVRILKVSYGKNCTKDSVSDCNDSPCNVTTITGLINSFCADRRSCLFSAREDDMPNVCHGHGDYRNLRVEYVCSWLEKNENDVRRIFTDNSRLVGETA